MARRRGDQLFFLLPSLWNISSSRPVQAFCFISMGQLIKGMENFKDLETKPERKVMLKDFSREKPINFMRE